VDIALIGFHNRLESIDLHCLLVLTRIVRSSSLLERTDGGYGTGSTVAALDYAYMPTSYSAGVQSFR
jgi:hypothetical protein